MAALKTVMNEASVDDFLQTIQEATKREDCLKVLALMKSITKTRPKMWGTAIIGFGSYHYKSERSRQEGDWFLTGFSPRKQSITIYLLPGVDQFKTEIKKLGKCKASGSCLYINKLADVSLPVLKELISKAYAQMKEITRHKK